jgi:hypothetical protein
VPIYIDYTGNTSFFDYFHTFIAWFRTGNCSIFEYTGNNESIARFPSSQCVTLCMSRPEPLLLKIGINLELIVSSGDYLPM